MTFITFLEIANILLARGLSEGDWGRQPVSSIWYQLKLSKQPDSRPYRALRQQRNPLVRSLKKGQAG
jgi:hypothetical protein